MPTGRRKGRLYPITTKSTTAPGYRDTGINGRLGALMNIGDSGFSYSSSANGANGIFLDFHPQLINPNDTHGRGFGLQLRCLSE